MEFGPLLKVLGQKALIRENDDGNGTRLGQRANGIESIGSFHSRLDPSLIYLKPDGTAQKFEYFNTWKWYAINATKFPIKFRNLNLTQTLPFFGGYF